MPDQLTSVRFDHETVEALRLLADLHDSNVASEVREAVRRYIRDVTESEDFDERLKEAERNRRALIERVLANNG